MTPKRRVVLIGIATAVSLAGCLGDDDAGGTDTGDDDGTDTGDDDGTDTDDDEVGDGAVTIAVGHGGSFVFDPESVEIDVGDTVEFVWEGAGHNIIVTEQPDGADWNGVESTHGVGHSHSHTFGVEGRYAFVCAPHEGQGMDGEVLVGAADSGAGDDGEDAGGGGRYGY